MPRGKRKRQRRARSLADRLRDFLARFARGEEVDEDTATHLQEIKGLALVGFSVWLFASLLSYEPAFGTDEPLDGAGNWGGQAGRYLAEWVFVGLGWSAYFLVFLGLTWGLVLIARKRIGWPVLRVFGGLCFLLSAAFLFELGFGVRYGAGLPFGPGGYFALELAGPGAAGAAGEPGLLVEKLGRPGLWILLSFSTLLSFMLATEMAFYPAASALREWIADRRGESRGVLAAILAWLGRLVSGLWDFLRGADLQASTVPSTAVAPARARGGRARKSTAGLFPEQEEDLLDDEEAEEEEEDDDEVELAAEDEGDEEEDDEEEDEYEEYDEDDDYDEDDEDDDDEEEITPAREVKPAAPVQATIDFSPPKTRRGEWKYPPLELLEPPYVAGRQDARGVEMQAKRLEHALMSFRVEASVVGAQVGPAVTLFELEVTQGTRMNKVTQLSQEIAAALRARNVRIIAPIPGKSTIGIEVPNDKRRVVRLSELVRPEAYDRKFAALPLFMGMDAEGKAIVEDLARMPHLLIAGTTGSGKSVCINSILASLLLTRSPHDVQLILIDPKMVELQMFSRVPHLILPVVSDMRQATNVLLWAVDKMEGRYDLFNRAGVRNIKTFNGLGEDGLRERLGDDFNEERTPRHLPYIVIVIDEMADLMMTSKKEAELVITRLAQKSRAVGIHVIVATQRPSTDVITGVLKGNLPTRVAFQVASKVDSRVILDCMGAEKLLGQGDMLYTPPQSSQILRVQGALVEDHEIQALVEFLAQESAPEFNQELIQTATGSAGPGQAKPGAEQDDLYDEAVRIVVKSRRGSASLLQRALGIGYTRASRLIDIMTSEGIVGEHKGSKAREVLLSLDDWEAMQEATAGQGASHE